MASSFSEDECVRLFTLSLPESFQFFSVVACAIGSILLEGSTVETFLPQAFHRLRCLTWVKSDGLPTSEPLPVCPDKQTFSMSGGMSQTCQKTAWAELFELSSAVASSVDRTSMPSAFAVLR